MNIQALAQLIVLKPMTRSHFSLRTESSHVREAVARGAHWRRWLVPGLVSAVLLGFGSMARGAWDEPAGFPPNGASVQAPLNTSGYLQTRSDDLTLQGTLEIGNKLETQGTADITSKLDIAGQLCFGSDCRDSFTVYSDTYLRREPSSPDQGSVVIGDKNGAGGGGSVSVTATSSVIASQETAVTSNAASPDSLPTDPKVTYGLLGTANTGPTRPDFLSVGVYGLARADSPFSVGVGGEAASTYETGAYAGYFQGRVKIAGQLCFAGQCRDEWPDWTGAGYFVKLADAGTPSQVGNADLDASSASAFESLVIGGVVSGVPIEVSCGDGICNNNETVSNCPNDCFAIENLAVSDILDGTARITWTTTAPATTLVQYGLTEGLGTAVGDTAMLSSHAVTLSSLQQNATIYYRAISRSASGLTRLSGVLSFSTLVDTTPPEDPSNLQLYGFAAPTELTIMWYHSWEDNPGGSGFKEFRIYRNSLQVEITTDQFYTDTNITPNQNYTYSVTAVDNSDNESGLSNPLLVHVPTACTTSANCTNPSYPVCCDDYGCQEGCEGSSPAVLKADTEPTPPSRGW